MSEGNVRIGGCYLNKENGIILKVVAASSPDYRNFVELIEPRYYPYDGNKGITWKSNWYDFEAQWEPSFEGYDAGCCYCSYLADANSKGNCDRGVAKTFKGCGLTEKEAK